MINKFFIPSFLLIGTLFLGCGAQPNRPSPTISNQDVGISDIGTDGTDGGDGGDAGKVTVYAPLLPDISTKAGSGGSGGGGGRGKSKNGKPGKPGNPGKAGMVEARSASAEFNIPQKNIEVFKVEKDQTVYLEAGEQAFKTLEVYGTLKTKGDALIACDNLILGSNGKIDFEGTSDHLNGFSLVIYAHNLTLDGNMSASGLQSSIPGTPAGNGGTITINATQCQSAQGSVVSNGAHGLNGANGQ